MAARRARHTGALNAGLVTAPPPLRARDLRKAHGSGRARREILAGADLDVRPGELVAIVGRSGSGKSTLLQILGGLDQPDSGTVEVAGRAVAGPQRPSERELSAVRRDQIGFVFQFFHLIPELDGAANVLLPATLPGASREARRRGRELIELLGLADVAGLRPHQLSGGEQQRFALARALVGDPAVILADEPIGNLDAAAAETALALLRRVADEGRAVVMVTHQAEATAQADRVLRLEEGRLAVA